MDHHGQLAQFDSATQQIRQMLLEATHSVAITKVNGVSTITVTPIPQPEKPKKEATEQ